MFEVKKMAKKWFIPDGFWNLCIAAKEIKKQMLYSPEEKTLLKENIATKDRHKGQRCFILGSGPSIKEQDLTKLAGEVVVSVSNSFVHPAIPLIRPQYHVLPPVFASHGSLYSVDKFISWFAEMEEKTFSAEMFFHIGDRSELVRHGLYKNRKVHWVDYTYWDESSTPEVDLSKIPSVSSVSETAITVAIHLGFDEIYLLGFDHDWFNELFTYFFDAQKEHKMQPTKEVIPFVDSEFQMRRHARIFKKYKYLYSLKQNIYNVNANPNSYVDVFPKVSLDDVLKSKSRVAGE